MFLPLSTSLDRYEINIYTYIHFECCGLYNSYLVAGGLLLPISLLLPRSVSQVSAASSQYCVCAELNMYTKHWNKQFWEKWNRSGSQKFNVKINQRWRKLLFFSMIVV